MTFDNSKLPKGFVRLDEVAEKFHLNGFLPGRSLQKGQYIFLDELRGPDVVLDGINDKFHLISRAICIIRLNNETLGHLAEFNISSLISSFSTCNGIKASKLYGIPHNTSNSAAWDEMKTAYIQNQIIGKLILVEKAERANEIQWRFGKQVDLPSIDKNIKLSDALKKYLGERSVTELIREL